MNVYKIEFFTDKWCPLEADDRTPLCFYNPSHAHFVAEFFCSCGLADLWPKRQHSWRVIDLYGNYLSLAELSASIPWSHAHFGNERRLQ